MNFAHDISRPLILLGAGGHAKVMLALAIATGCRVTGVCDPELAATGMPTWRGVPVLGGDEVLFSLDPRTYGLINGVGQLPKQGFVFPALVHPNAWVAESAELSDGVQVMAGAVIQPDCSIGFNTTINTGASIDHDCRLGANVHVAPGATLCGGINVADGVYVGAGATVIHGISIGDGAVVGAGVACVRDVKAGETVIGAPIRRALKN
jgi:sugar O-acyltransferase (sialic acid O-acetyltransferase NeuD family)